MQRLFWSLRSGLFILWMALTVVPWATVCAAGVDLHAR